MNTKVSSNKVSDNSIPLSLYIHIPWCVKKCPYCDFNSYALKSSTLGINTLPEEDAYVATLLRDFQQDLTYIFDRPLKSIFFGGGTPSLFSPKAFETILNEIEKQVSFAPNIEITMEANPGTLEHKAFIDYKQAGINRVSLGVQSFQNEKLQALGRIHQVKDLEYAFESLAKANLYNFNIDLMYGLPEQTVTDALFDLERACSFSPTHLSWYHLTLEHNTFFHKYPPVLPAEEITDTLQIEGLAFLKANGFRQYEVSAYAKPGFESQHNLNYWTFGDYLGIGAGAHGKISDTTSKTILRYSKTRSPASYLSSRHTLIAERRILSAEELPLEFMLNALRLMDTIPLTLFEERCFMPAEVLSKPLRKAEEQGFLRVTDNNIHLTDFGKRFLNEALQLF